MGWQFSLSTCPSPGTRAVLADPSTLRQVDLGRGFSFAGIQVVCDRSGVQWLLYFHSLFASHTIPLCRERDVKKGGKRSHSVGKPSSHQYLLGRGAYGACRGNCLFAVS